MDSRKYYLEGELFPFAFTRDNNGKKISTAQVPYIYGEEHCKLLNEIVKYGIKHEDVRGRIYYTIEKPEPINDIVYIRHN